MTQSQFGELVGVTQQTVSDLHKRCVLRQGGTAGEWLLDYCGNLREVAAARLSADGSLDLVAERARLARAQSIRVEMQNAIAARELAPVHVIAEVLSRVGRQIAVTLEAIPVQLKRRSRISIEDLQFITTEIVRVRNLAANIQLSPEDLKGLEALSDPNEQPTAALDHHARRQLVPQEQRPDHRAGVRRTAARQEKHVTQGWGDGIGEAN